MKKLFPILLSVSLIFAFFGCNNADTKKEETTMKDYTVSNRNVLETTSYFTDQDIIDENLRKEAKAGYSFNTPQIILNPYGTSPLSAVVIFSTDVETDGTITVKGKDEKDNITGGFDKGINHIVPIYGLYNDDTTKVEISLSTGETNTFEVQTEDALSNYDLGKITATMYDDSKYDYGTLTLACASRGVLYALDSKGDIRWCYTDCGALGVKQLENGHLLVPTTYTLKPTYYQSGIKEIDFSGKVYNEYAVPGGQHHDVYEMENGNFLVASENSDFSSVEDCVIEIDRTTGEVVWELDMKDLLDTTHGKSASNLSDGTEEIDWFHNNGVWYDSATDTVLLSARHIDAVVGINKTTKQLSWILGNPEDWENTDKRLFFTPVGDNFEWQYAQHNVTVLDNGDIMLFDNGTAKVKYSENDSRVTGDDIYSRAVVYRIDTENMTIRQIWQYGKERGPEWYSDWISGSVSLDGTIHNVLITSGSNLYNPETKSYDYNPTNMFTPGLIKSTYISHVIDNKLAFEIKISGDSTYPLTYRSFKIMMYPKDGTLNVDYKGDYIGGLGKIASEDMEFTSDELSSAGENTSLEWKLDKTKLTVSGIYTDDSADSVSDNYIVLACADGTQYVRKMNQSVTENEDGTANVTLNGWISRQSLLESDYDIYIKLDGTLYNTGYQFHN